MERAHKISQFWHSAQALPSPSAPFCSHTIPAQTGKPHSLTPDWSGHSWPVNQVDHTSLPLSRPPSYWARTGLGPFCQPVRVESLFLEDTAFLHREYEMLLCCSRIPEHPRKGKTGKHRKEHFFKNKNTQTYPKKPFLCYSHL